MFTHMITQHERLQYVRDALTLASVSECCSLLTGTNLRFEKCTATAPTFQSESTTS